MQSFADLAKALNRSPVYLSGLQKRFELPTFAGATYPPAYLAFLRGLTAAELPHVRAAFKWAAPLVKLAAHT